MTKLNCLTLYPNFLKNNPTANQFDHFCEAIRNTVHCHVVALPDPVERHTSSVTSVITIPYYNHFWSYSGEFIKHHLPSIAVPDEMRWSTNPLMAISAKKVIHRDPKIDFIMTLSYPLSCHLLGLRLKRRYHLPWVAMFYDPWTDNPHRHPSSSFIKNLDGKLEKKVAENVDAAIFTNDTMRDLWVSRYGREAHAFVLPFCYTSKMVNAHQSVSACDTSEGIIILYTGICNEERNLSDIIHAVNNLSHEGYNLDKLKIWVVGPIFSPDVSLAESLNVLRYFHFWGQYPPESMPQFYQRADYFLVVDAPSTNNVHFPSKLMDYFYYQRPILGITPLKGCTAEILKQSGHTIIPNGDISAIEDFLSLSLQGKNDVTSSFDREWWCHYTPDSISESFMTIVRALFPTT